MRRPALLAPLIVLLLAIAAPAAHAQARDPAPVVVAKIDGTIDGTLASFLTDTLDEAARTGATVVLQLDSAGTLDQDAVALARRVFDSPVPVIVWVGPAPAKAQGAALLLLYASSLPAVSPGAGIGPLEPLDLVDAQQATMPSGDQIERTAAGWARARGRSDVTFPSSPVPAQSAIDGGIAVLAAPSVTDLLGQVDGRTVRTATGGATLRTRIATEPGQPTVDVRFADLGPVDRVLHAMASPAAIYVLLVLGFAALAFELTQPGFGFAGFGGLGMLALAIYGLTAVPASWVGLGMLVLGVILLQWDVLLRRLGVLTAAGLAAFTGGSFLAFRGVAPAIQISPWLIVAFAVATVLYYGFALTVALQSRDRITSTQKGLVGLVGETRGELTPEGPVFVKGTLWRGRSTDGPIPPGSRVRVRGVDGLILRVEADPGSDTGSEREPGPEPGPEPGQAPSG